MDKQLYEEKMSKMKKGVKCFFFASLILSIALLIIYICYNFAGIFTIQTLPGTKYEEPFTYPGWQTIYYGVGDMIIQGYTEFTFNVFNFLAFWFVFIALIVWLILYLKWYKRKGTNKKKAILEFIVGGLAIIGSIMLFNCDKFAIMNAKNVTGSYQNYYEMYLKPALNGEVSFHKTFYPTLILISGLLTGAVKILNGLLLIKQKIFAQKNKGVK